MAAPTVPPTPSYALALSEAEQARYAFMAQTAREQEGDLWHRAGIVPGARIADVGCGPGALLPILSELVGPDGRIDAVDADPGAVALARASVSAAECSNVQVTVGQAQATGLPYGAYDVVMLRHVLAHNARAESAIVGHLATLLRPGGTLYLVDTDGYAVRVVPQLPDLTELDDRYRALQRMRGNDGQSGLRLAELVERAGLDLVTYQGRYTISRIPAGVRPPSWAARDAMVDAGVASAADVARRDRALTAHETAGASPTIFVPVFIALGRAAV